MRKGKCFKFNDMKMTFKTSDDLIEWVYAMHLQNTNGRETENEMFRLGIENCIQELTELNLLDLLPVVSDSDLELAIMELEISKMDYHIQIQELFRVRHRSNVLDRVRNRIAKIRSIDKLIAHYR